MTSRGLLIKVCAVIAAAACLSACTGATSPLPKTLDRVPKDAVLVVAISPNPSDAPIDLHPRGYVAFIGGSSDDEYLKTPAEGEQYMVPAFGRDGTVAFTDRDGVHVLGTSMATKKRGPHSRDGAFGTPYQLANGSFAYLYNIGFADSVTDYRYGMEFSGNHEGLSLPEITAMGVCDGTLAGIRLIPDVSDIQYESYRLVTIGPDLRTIHYPGSPTKFALFRPPQDADIPCADGKLYIRRRWSADIPELRKKTPRFNNELTVFDVKTGAVRDILMKYSDGSPVRDGDNADPITIIHKGRYIWRSPRGKIYGTDITTGVTSQITDTKLRGFQSYVTYANGKIYALDKGGVGSKGQLRIYSLDTGALLEKMPTPALDKAYDRSGDSAITGIAARPDKYLKP